MLLARLSQPTPRVAVLLSTYNGEAYLAAQLDSLDAQVGVSVDVIARDDGSTDGTLDILRRYGPRWPRLASVVAGPNVGPAESFMSLMVTAGTGYDYYAFCDQDDIWLPEKLLRAARRLEANVPEGPGLYCSPVTCVDHALNPLGDKLLMGTGRFEEVIFANIAHGNTMVVNAAGAECLRSRRPGAGMVMHDWWSALVIAGVGKVVCDDTSNVLYRQHQANVYGGASERLRDLSLQLRKFLKDPGGFYPIHGQAAELLSLYGDDLGAEARAVATALVASRRSLASRLHYITFCRIPRWDLWGSIGTRVLIAAGLY